FVVVTGLRDTGVTQLLGTRLLRRPHNLRHAQLRMMAPVTVLSAFVNNTPVVAALIPAVNDWCRRHHLPVSQLMMPLSFAAILGGTCTLIGTSTNLLLNALLIEQAGLRHLPGLFLAGIDRNGNSLPAVSPDQPLQADDHLRFVGVIDSVVDLQKLRGLAPANNQLDKLDAPRRQRVLAEAVVSHSCQLVGESIREGAFRNRYNAVVLAVARD